MGVRPIRLLAVWADFNPRPLLSLEGNLPTRLLLLEAVEPVEPFAVRDFARQVVMRRSHVDDLSRVP